MTSPEIKILLSLAFVATIYAFVSEIRMAQRARRLRAWVQDEWPDLWCDLTVIARHWNGGQPGLKLLYRRNMVDHPRFHQEYDQIRSAEQQLLGGIAVGVGCIGLVILGVWLWGWQW